MARPLHLDDDDDTPRIERVRRALPATVAELRAVLGGCSAATVYHYLDRLDARHGITADGWRRPRIYRLST